MTTRRPSGGLGVRRERTPFEWAVLVVSLAATLAVMTGLAVSGLAGPGGPADLRVIVAGEDRPAAGGRPLTVVVENLGGTSARNVIVEVAVGEVTREVDLDLVAKGDTESATVVVPAGATGRANAEIVSYSNP